MQFIRVLAIYSLLSILILLMHIFVGLQELAQTLEVIFINGFTCLSNISIIS